MTTCRATNEISLHIGGPELIDRIEPLWYQLREHHAELPTIWQSSFLNVSFDKRRTHLLAKATQGMLVVLATSRDADVGYCVSSIDHGIGEVDSIFVVEAYRRLGVGDAMMSPTMDWFKEKSVKSIMVDILEGNNVALAFYATYGFRPRTVRLQKTNE